MKEDYENWLTIAKGYGIILVVLGHAISGAWAYENNLIWSNIYSLIALFHMPLFFIISGYLYQKNYKKRSLSNNIVRKVAALGIPYIIYNVVYALVGQLTGDDKYNIQNLRLIGYRPISHFWFVYVLLIIYIIYPLMNKLIHNNIALFLVILLVNIIISLCNLHISGFEVSRCIYYSLFFSFGTILLIYNFRKLMNNKKMIIICTAFFILICGLNIAGYSNIIFNILGGITGTILVMAISAVTKENFIFKLGKFSLPIYLYHSLIVSFSRKVLMLLKINNLSIVILVTSFVGVMLSYYIYVVFKRLKIFDFSVYPLKYLMRKKL